MDTICARIVSRERRPLAGRPAGGSPAGAATFDNVAAFGSANEELWLGVRVLPGVEGPRRKVTASTRPIRVLADPMAAITADGYVESTIEGSRFPDATVQTTASTAVDGVRRPQRTGAGGPSAGRNVKSTASSPAAVASESSPSHDRCMPRKREGDDGSETHRGLLVQKRVPQRIIMSVLQ